MKSRNFFYSIRQYPSVLVFLCALTCYSFAHVRVLSLAHDSLWLLESFYLSALEDGFSFSCFNPHFLFSKAVYIIALKGVFAFGFPATVMAALNTIFMLNVLFCSVSVVLFFQLLRRRLNIVLKSALLTTALFGFSFVVWAYLTTVEIYPFSFMMGIFALYHLFNREWLHKYPVWAGAIHAVAALCHIRYILLGIIPLWYLLVRYREFKQFTIYFITSCAIFTGAYVVFIFSFISEFNPLVPRLFEFFSPSGGVHYGISLKNVVLGVVNMGRSVFGGLFLFSHSLDPWLSKALPLHHLYDEYFLFRDIGGGQLGVLTISAVTGVLIFTWLLVTFKKRESSAPLLILFFAYFGLALYADPVAIDQFVIFPLFLFALIARPSKLLVPLLVVLFIVNYWGGMKYLKDLNNDYYYAQVMQIERKAQPDDLVIFDFDYPYDTYIKLFTPLKNVAYLTSESIDSLNLMSKKALEQGHEVFIHPNARTITPYAMRRFGLTEGFRLSD